MKGFSGVSWHQIYKKKFERDKERVDFFVLLTYLPVWKHKLHTFENRFVIVPTRKLKRRIEGKNAGKKGIYSFYFHFNKGGVVEVRDTETDYSEFIDNWSLIHEALHSL